jgi:translation initiation factor 1
MSKHNDNKNKIIFSTNPDFKPEAEGNEQETIAANKQTLYIALERLKGGKVATIVTNFIGTDADLQALGKQLKSKCGGGGTVKDGIILIQGEHRDKIMDYLSTLGYKVKKKGG